MSLALGAAIYAICWWLVLFTILPVGVRTQEEDGHVEPGTPASAPARPLIVRKLLATTVLSAVLFGAIYAAVANEVITLDTIPFLPEFGESARAR